MSGSPYLNGVSKPNAKSIYEQRKRYSNVIMADVSQYQVNHLVTFTIDEDDDVHTVEDAIRKLNTMDAKGKVWVQEMILQVNSSTVKLLDVDSKEDLEMFPVSAIQRCETIVPERRNNSLLVLVCQDRYQPKADVHFFQCDQVGAELIREDINSAVSDYKSGHSSRRPEALRNNQEQISKQGPSSENNSFEPRRQWKQPHIHYVTPAEILERESQRRSARSSASSLNPQVIINPVPPMQQQQSSNATQEAIYTKIFKPDKYSPQQKRNSALAEDDGQDLMALRAGREVDLLNHCFDDIEFFMGKLQKSAEAFKVLNQRKKSRRGKKPETGEGLLTLRAKPPKLEEFEDAAEKFKYSFCLLARLRNNIMNPSSVELIHFLFGPLKMLVDSSGGPEMVASIKNPMLTKEAVSLLKECLDENEIELWNSLGPNWTRPRLEFPRDYCPPYNPNFRSGWIPTNIDGRPWEDPVELQHRHEELRSQQSAPQVQQPPPPPVLNGHQEEINSKRVSCTYDFVARNSTELSVLHGELLEVLDDSKKWWKVQNRFGQIGYVPYNILAPETETELNKAKQNGLPPSSPAKKPPTPPQKPPKANPVIQPQWNSVNSQQPEQNHIQQEKYDRISSMNEELLLRLANGRTAPQKNLNIHRMSDTSIPLDEESSPSEVTAWLQAKGFNTLTVKSLGVLNGAQLFSLRKDEFRAVSPEEGARVYSQVMVQKSLLEDTKKISELEAVMERQKKKVDTELLEQSGSL
ncbi:epidermal growth factor receptor kinase substrate 8-like protein 1 [Gastrophryne carolinensis]